MQLFMAKWHFMLGNALGKWGKYRAGVRHLERGLALNPNDLSACLMRGWCYSHMQEHQRAFEAYDRAVQLSPVSAYARLSLGDALYSLARYTEAADSIGRALRMAPKYREQARYPKLLGLAQAQIGQNQDALDNLLKADQLSPGDPETTYWIGRLFIFIERYDQAEVFLRKAAMLEPDDYHCHAELGLALYGLEKWNESAEEYEQAIQLKPDWTDGYISIGKACRESADYTRSIDAIKQAINLQPKNPDHYLQLAVSYGEAGLWEESLEADKMLVMLRPDDKMSYISMSAALHALERHQESIEACHNALKIDPDCMPALEIAGYEYLSLDRFEEAVNMLRHAISIKPETPYFHAWLAHAYAGLNKEGAARAEVSAVMLLDPQMGKDIEMLVKDTLK